MTVQYATIEPALATLFEQLLAPERVGDVSALDLVMWENAERHMAQRAYLVLSWVSEAEVGVPQVTHALVTDQGPNDGLLQETASANYLLVLQLSAESFSQLSNEHASIYLSRLRSRLRWAVAHEALSAIGLALVDASTVRRDDYEVDERQISRALLELRFNYAGNETNADESGFVSYIATVEMSSDVEHIDGLPLDVDLQLNDKVMP